MKNTSKFSVREANASVDFALVTVIRLADGQRLKRAERATQSEEHRLLVSKSARWFRDNGARVNRHCFGVAGVYAASDFGVMDANGFQFAEVCSRYMPIGSLEQKKALSRYAPLWLIMTCDNPLLTHLADWPWLLVRQSAGGFVHERTGVGARKCGGL